MHRVVLAAFLGTSTLLTLTGCSASANRARPPASPSSADAATSPSVKDFQVQLKDISASARRTFGTSGDSYARSQNGATIQLSLALQDMIGGRLFRVREGSAIRSVLDGAGRELLKPGEGAILKPGSSSGRPEFAAVSDTSSRPPAYSITFSTPRVPESIRRIRGEFRLDVAVEDADRTVPIAAVEEPFEICPGVTAVVKMLDIPEPPPPPPTPGPSASSSQQPQPPRISVEVRTRSSTADQTAPVVLSVEVLDSAGGVITPLARREESTIGPVYRRRFTTDSNNYQYPRERGGPKPPKSFRFHILTTVEPVTVPFEFGPIDLGGE